MFVNGITTKLKETTANYHIDSITTSLADMLNALNINYLDRLSIHLVAAKEKPSALLLLRRDYKNIDNTITCLRAIGFHTTNLDRSNTCFYELIVALDKQICEKLKIALQENNKYDIGTILGYPKNAVLNFVDASSEEIDTQPKRIHSYSDLSYACISGLNNGKKIPNFFCISVTYSRDSSRT